MGLARAIGTWLAGGDFYDGWLGPPKADVPTSNPRPGHWSDGHARNMAYRYQQEVAPMHRSRPSWQEYSYRWDTQPTPPHWEPPPKGQIQGGGWEW